MGGRLSNLGFPAWEFMLPKAADARSGDRSSHTRHRNMTGNAAGTPGERAASVRVGSAGTGVCKAAQVCGMQAAWAGAQLWQTTDTVHCERPTLAAAGYRRRRQRRHPPSLPQSRRLLLLPSKLLRW